MKEYLNVETFFGPVCRVELEVVARKDEKNILVKGWNCYKELSLCENGKIYWMVKNEFREIPEDWKNL